MVDIEFLIHYLQLRDHVGFSPDLFGARDALIAAGLLPEGLAAARAARADRLQTSLNLALGSALATIGLTIPVVAFLSILFDWKLVGVKLPDSPAA